MTNQHPPTSPTSDAPPDGVAVLRDLAALDPAGLATAIRTIRQQTGDTPTQLAARIGVDPTSVHGWTAGRHTPQLPHLVGLGKLRGPTSPPRLASLPYLTLAQVAALFHVHKYTVIRWAESGKLPSVLVNSH